MNSINKKNQRKRFSKVDISSVHLTEVSVEEPNKSKNQLLKKQEGTTKYAIKKKNIKITKLKSSRAEKNKTSAKKNKDPGKPRKTTKEDNVTKYKLGV